MKKTFATSLIVLSLIGSMNTTGFAASNGTIAVNSGTTSSSVSEDYCRKERPQLTPEQKAEMDAKRKEWIAKIQDSQNKWSTLTNAQKNEIYALMDQQIDIKIQTIDKYLEDGVIDKDSADKIKAKLSEHKAKMRESGKMPMIRMDR